VQWFKCFLAGVNAAAIGLIFAACVSLWEKAVDNNAQASAFMLTGALVSAFKVPAPIAIVLGGLLGFLLSPGVGPLGLAQTPFCPAAVQGGNGTGAV
jgi:chromate transport protein ChrA